MNGIDTNVWIYSHDSRDPQKQSVAQQLISTTRPLALPWQVGCEFIVSPGIVGLALPGVALAGRVRVHRSQP
jgi:hypothetical protein